VRGAELAFTGRVKNLVTATVVTPGGKVMLRCACWAAPSEVPNSRMMARRAIIGSSLTVAAQLGRRLCPPFRRVAADDPVVVLAGRVREMSRRRVTPTRRALPLAFIPPCIPTWSRHAPAGPDWVHEIKHDGYRLMVRRQGARVRLFTRGASAFIHRRSLGCEIDISVHHVTQTCTTVKPTPSVPSGMWLEFGDAVSERMKVSPQAARSIGWAMGGVGSVCQPSILRMLI
jgi:hypothetical protein